MRNRPLLATALIISALAQPACAQQTPKPPELNDAFQSAAPYGAGTFTYCMLKIYDAALWTDADQWSMQEPFALSLRYNIDIEKSDLLDKTIDQMNDQQPLSPDETAAYRAILDRIYPQLKDGDALTALYMPGKNMRLYHNGELIGTTDNMVFAQRFFAVWLSDRTTAPDLRRHLLKLN